MNVWLLLIGDRGERVLGPFAGVSILPWSIRDALTGDLVVKLTGAAVYMLPDGSGHFDRVVIQSGTFESPWGDRGR
jgi:hypothetical protein